MSPVADGLNIPYIGFIELSVILRQRVSKLRGFDCQGSPGNVSPVPGVLGMNSEVLP